MDPKEAGLEQERIDHDLALKTRELDLKQRELDLKERELTGKNTRWLTPQQATILVAVIGIVAAAIGTIVQGILSQRLERDRFRTSLILKAVETGDRKQASDNLLRLFEWHLIDDPNGQIVNAIRLEPADVPVLPRADSDSSGKSLKSTTVTVPPIAVDTSSNIANTVLTFNRNDLVTEAGGSPGGSRQVSVLLNAPGPIENIDLSIEGPGAPWMQTVRFDKISDRQWKWIGSADSAAPAFLVFRIKYHLAPK